MGKCNFTNYKRIANSRWTALMTTTQSHLSWTSLEMNSSLAGWRERVSGRRKLLQRFVTERDVVSGLGGTGESSEVGCVVGRGRLARTDEAIIFPQDWLFALVSIRPRSEVILRDDFCEFWKPFCWVRSCFSLTFRFPSVKPT